MFDEIPCVLKQLIWDFAYNCDIKRSPWGDLTSILEIRRCIPQLFLIDRIPLKEMGPEKKCLNVCPLNPFKKGNPYFPAAGLCLKTIMWSDVICHAIDLLNVRKVGTYRGHLHNKIRRMWGSPLYYWNSLCVNFFMRYPGIGNPDNYTITEKWQALLVQQFTDSLLSAQLISPLLVFLLT